MLDKSGSLHHLFQFHSWCAAKNWIDVIVSEKQETKCSATENQSQNYTQGTPRYENPRQKQKHYSYVLHFGHMGSGVVDHAFDIKSSSPSIMPVIPLLCGFMCVDCTSIFPNSFIVVIVNPSDNNKQSPPFPSKAHKKLTRANISFSVHE